MSISTTNYSELKTALKEALLELFQEHRDLFQNLVKEAASEADLFEQADNSPTPGPSEPADDDIEKTVTSEISAFHKLYPVLREQHSGEYVAIHNLHLVDHDSEKFALYQRIQERFPDQFVLMRRVEHEPENELHFRSTRYSVRAS